MSRWFRFHADAMRNPKVAQLTDREFRLWVRLLTVASENDGCIPSVADLKRVLNARLDHLLAGVERLLSVGLIDRKEDGYEPHHWSKFQYKSDTSTDRVRKHRAERNVSETAPEADTDTEAETDKKNTLDERGFDEWYSAFPRRVGKGQARKAYRAALKKASADVLLAGAQEAASRYAGSDPRFVPHPTTWLNGERWLDTASSPRRFDPDAEIYRNVL